MAMAIGLSGIEDTRTEREEARAARRDRIGDALRAVLNKRDDRLLRDAGLTREDALGVEAAFWHERSRERTLWSL